MPFLSHITLPKTEIADYPFSIPAFKEGLTLRLHDNVTFFVGENGSGKSTLLEAIADQCGFSLRGGNRNHNVDSGKEYNGYNTPLSGSITLGWTPKRISNGFFMRAESFFNFADYIDEIAEEDPDILDAYGGKSLHEQSHGESFLSLFQNQFSRGIYILDEPEATHSPMLLCYPEATIFNFGTSGLKEIGYKDTAHYQLTKSFLDNPDAYFRFLFD